MNLRAVFPPMPTPFLDGEVHTAAITSNISRWMGSGLGGVLVLGTNGEAPLLDEDEADRVIEAARRAVPAGRTLLVGAGRESTRATIAAARRAAAGGADAVVVRTPSLYRAHTPVAALADHYLAVAEASPVPVLLYNYPAFTGVNLTPDFVARLAAHPNIVGVKETSTDGAQFAELAAVVPERFTILSGSAPGCFAALCAGARGAILAVACVAPQACLELVELDSRRTPGGGACPAAAPDAAGARRDDRLRDCRPQGRARRCRLRRRAILARRCARCRSTPSRKSARCSKGFMLPSTERLLFGPGPSPVSPRVMRAMSAPVFSHLDAEMMTILDGIRASLATIFKSGPDSLALATSGTGTSGMEAAVANLTRPGATALVVVTGYFGERLVKMLERYGAAVAGSTSSGGEPAIRSCSNASWPVQAPTSWHGPRRDVDWCPQSSRGAVRDCRPARRADDRRYGDVARRPSGRSRRLGRRRVLLVHAERARRTVRRRADCFIGAARGSTSVTGEYSAARSISISGCSRITGFAASITTRSPPR